MSNKTPVVPLELPPAKPEMFADNRRRLLQRFQNKPDVPQHSLLFLQGLGPNERNDTDTEWTFRQESCFYWMFGVEQQSVFGAVSVEDGRTWLFFPKLPDAYAVWLGEIHSLDYFKEKYGVDEVHYVHDMAGVVAKFDPEVIYTNEGRNEDSGNYNHGINNFPEIRNYRRDMGKLYAEMSDVRVIKSEFELEFLRWACKISSDAHVKLMRECRPGMKEFQLEAIFHEHVHRQGGMRLLAYQAIVGAGKNGAVLHYLDNDATVADGDMLLIDMGGEYSCYASDITCSFPANGKFTEDQKAIYNTVLAAQNAVFAQLKPGVQWTDMHILAEKEILKGLLSMGLVTGDLEELHQNRISALFFPHGLGHLLGMDVHDVGGYLKNCCCPPRLDQPSLRSLRTRRTMQKNMVVTVEPGLYFIKALLEPALADPAKAKYLNRERIEGLMNFGGVRLEDDVVITENGFENLTKCPRTVEQIEAACRGEEWHKL